MDKIKINCLAADYIEIDVDDNPMGLPVLFLSAGFGDNRRAVMLKKENVEELIKVLQRKLTEM